MMTSYFSLGDKIGFDLRTRSAATVSPRATPPPPSRVGEPTRKNRPFQLKKKSRWGNLGNMQSVFLWFALHCDIVAIFTSVSDIIAGSSYHNESKWRNHGQSTKPTYKSYTATSTYRTANASSTSSTASTYAARAKRLKDRRRDYNANIRHTYHSHWSISSSRISSRGNCSSWTRNFLAYHGYTNLKILCTRKISQTLAKSGC